MFTTRTIIEIFAQPAAAALVIAAVLFALSRNRSKSHPSHRLGGLVIAAAYLAGHACHFPLPDWRNWQMVDAWQWLLPGVALLALLCVIDAVANRAWLRWVLRLAAVAALTAITLQPFASNTWTSAQAWQWIGGIALCGAAWWAMAEASDRRMHANWFAANWLMITIGVAALLILSGTQRFFELCVMLGAGLGAAMLLHIAGRVQLARGLYAVTPFVLLGLWINAWFYLEIDWWRIAAPAAAPFAAWAGSLLPQRVARRPWAVALVRLAAVSVVLAAAVVPAVWQYEPDPYAGY